MEAYAKDDLTKQDEVNQRYQDRLWEVAGRVFETGVMNDWPLYYVAMNHDQDPSGAWAWFQVFFPLDEVGAISQLGAGDLFATECFITGRGELSDTDNWRINCWRETIPDSMWAR